MKLKNLVFLAFATIGMSTLPAYSADEVSENAKENAGTTESWGYHLILDCKGCDIDKIKSAEAIKVFVKDLVLKIDMKAYGEPIIEYFATHNPTVGGYSLVQLIETSDITGHFVDMNGDAYIDIFSCKPYDINVAEKVVADHFNPKSIRKTYLERKA